MFVAGCWDFSGFLSIPRSKAFGLAGHGEGVSHCLALSCSSASSSSNRKMHMFVQCLRFSLSHCIESGAAGKHRSLSIALVLVYVFGLELWCPSVCPDPFETPDQVPIFKHASKKIDSMIGQLVEAAEFRPAFRKVLVSALSYNE